MNEKMDFAAELDLAQSLSVKELEERLEMESWCCDYAPEEGRPTSCGSR